MNVQLLYTVCIMQSLGLNGFSALFHTVAERYKQEGCILAKQAMKEGFDKNVYIIVPKGTLTATETCSVDTLTVLSFFPKKSPKHLPHENGYKQSSMFF